MANVFKPKRSSTASSVPTTSDLSDGEIAVNSADKKIYLRDGASIIEVANDGSSGTTSSLGVIASGHFSSAGATVYADGISCSRSSTGVFVITFGSALANTNYTIVGQIIEGADRDDIKIHVVDGTKATTGFTLNMYEGDNGTTADVLVDRGFFVTVIGTVNYATSIWSTDGTDAYRTTGSVGIGSDNPTAKLDVKQTNSDTVIGKLKGSAFTAYLNIEDSTTTSGNVAVGAAGNDLLLRAGNSNHVRLNFAGNLGIGTFNPTAKLDVRGNSFFSGNITVDGTVDGRDVATDGTKLDGIEASADVTDATNVDAAGAVMNSDTSTASMSFVVDEDNMVSDSATKVPTQQSVKAYVDANAGGGISNYAKYVGTGTPNINNAGYTEVSWINTTPQFSNGTWSATSSHIVVPATGLYMVQVNFYITASVVRSNVGLKFAVNDVQQSEIAAHNYIRNNSGHNESSINMSTTLSLSANDQVSIYTAQLANSGTVSLQGTSSTIAITQLA